MKPNHLFNHLETQSLIDDCRYYELLLEDHGPTIWEVIL